MRNLTKAYKSVVVSTNDVIGLKDLYLNVDLSKSTINMIKDTISSGDQISGVSYPTSSSDTNGSVTR